MDAAGSAAAAGSASAQGIARAERRQVVPPGRHQQAGGCRARQAHQHVENQPDVLRDADVAVGRM
ncbi:MAG TPA: hypothetical protein VHY76_16145 [Acetobacteraceae bacterium]|jgi:hypothetical protein|nr:hypothetical protein [Acetobacteraceae bacterium]